MQTQSVFPLLFSTFSEEKSRFLGVLKGRKFIWAWDWDVACGHCVPIGHQTRRDVRRACGSKEAAILQLAVSGVLGGSKHTVGLYGWYIVRWLCQDQ